jgi:16S rRNA (guanine527-N7)-methyltransferase
VTAPIAEELLANGVDEAWVEALARYGALLLGSTANVTGAKDAVAVAEHIVDSLTLLPYLQAPFIDVGTGGGLPGIPLALASGFAGTLLDANAKKIAFLRSVVAALTLTAVTVVGERAELAARETALRGSFASATARAVSSAPTVMEFVIPFLAVGGVAILQRGALDDRERHAARDAALVLGAEITDEIVVAGERRILLVTKRAETNPRFPRRNGVPEKRPLCLSA